MPKCLPLSLVADNAAAPYTDDSIPSTPTPPHQILWSSCPPDNSVHENGRAWDLNIQSPGTGQATADVLTQHGAAPHGRGGVRSTTN
ncbi:hypothetical protein MRB53_037368 [Persea americana]|nr:hypothetical protein MRB53_037368 [Persea americana]